LSKNSHLPVIDPIQSNQTKTKHR